jgi:hypothetical protein
MYPKTVVFHIFSCPPFTIMLCFERGYVLSSFNNLIPDSAGVKRQAGQGGSTAHAAPTVFCTFQELCRKTGRAVQIVLSEVECQKMLTKINYRIAQKSDFKRSDFITRNNVLLLPTQ